MERVNKISTWKDRQRYQESFLLDSQKKPPQTQQIYRVEKFNNPNERNQAFRAHIYHQLYLQPGRDWLGEKDWQRKVARLLEVNPRTHLQVFCFQARQKQHGRQGQRPCENPNHGYFSSSWRIQKGVWQIERALVRWSEEKQGDDQRWNKVKNKNRQ